MSIDEAVRASVARAIEERSPLPIGPEAERIALLTQESFDDVEAYLAAAAAAAGVRVNWPRERAGI